MKKLIAMILAMVICLGAFTGCSYAEVEKETENETVTSMFVQVEDSGYFKVLYHKDTKVMYAVSVGGDNAGNFVVMVNPDGTPMVWCGK